MRVALHPEARAELHAAAVWYDERRLGHFLQHVESRFAVGASGIDGGVFVDRHQYKVRAIGDDFKRRVVRA